MTLKPSVLNVKPGQLWTDATTVRFRQINVVVLEVDSVSVSVYDATNPIDRFRRITLSALGTLYERIA